MVFSALSLIFIPRVPLMYRRRMSTVKSGAVPAALLAFMVLVSAVSSSGEPVAPADPPISFVVTTLTDDVSGVPGNCPAGGPSGGSGQDCSLRDVVSAVDALAAGSSASITFASGLGSISTPGTITLLNGALSLSGTANVTITGLGTTALVIDGNNNGNILQIQNGVTASVSNLTMQHGISTLSQLGGAIDNEGTLMLTGVTVQSSQANLNGDSGGGGIYNGAKGTLTIVNSAIYSNSTSYFGGSSGLGGGILNEGGTVTITSSTIAGNQASLAGGNIYTTGGTLSITNSTITTSNSTQIGGGIRGDGTITVVDSTISGNQAGTDAGISASGTVTVTNSIVADNVDYTTQTSDCVGCTLEGNNIVDEPAYLSVPGVYGGTTQTLVPLPNSPAICAGAATTDKVDQRGYNRPTGSCYDIGAVQTSYAIAFGQQPTNTPVNTLIRPVVAVTTKDHGYGIPGATVNLTLNGPGILRGTLPGTTDATGTASFGFLVITAIGTGDTLTASASPTLTVTSEPFDILGDVPIVTYSPNPSAQTYGTAIAAGSLNATAAYQGSTISGSSSYTTTVNGKIQTLSTSTVLPAGSYSITATFTPADTKTYTSASANALYTVNQATSTITWAPVTTVNYGTSLAVLLNAKAAYVGGNLPGALTYTAQAAGGPVVPVTGSTILNAGSYTLTANFTPSDSVDYTTATKTATLTVTKTSLTVTANNAAKAYGAALPSFTGTITGIVNGDNITATYITTATTSSPVGTYPITATLNDPNGRLPNYTVTINQGTLTVSQYSLTVAANNATRAYGAQNPAFTGTVTGAANGDVFTESFVASATVNSTVGTYPIVPSVTGTNLSNYAVTIDNGTLTVTQAASTTTLTVSNASITPGQSLTLTAQVKSSTTGTPTGSVSFYDGSTLLNTATLASGTAGYTTTLSSGSHALTTVYSGDTNFAASNSGAASTVTVGSLDFTISVNGASSQTVIPGRAVNYLLNVTPLSGTYPGPVNFSISGLPTGATDTFSPADIAVDGGAQTITLAIQTTSASASNAISPLGRRLAPIALGLLLLPLAGTRHLRRTGRTIGRMLCLLLLLLGGAISTGVLSGCGTNNGFFGQAPKNYTVSVTAISGTVQHTAAVNLNLQ